MVAQIPSRTEASFAPPVARPERPAPARILGIPAARPRSLAAVTTVLFLDEIPATLGETLDSLHWCDEVLVFALARNAAEPPPPAVTQLERVRWYWVNHLPTARQQALQLAKHDWVWLLEADEVVSPALALELTTLRPELAVVYTLPVQLYFRGRPARSLRAQPRLFNRRVGGWQDGGRTNQLQTGHLRSQRLRHPLTRRWMESTDHLVVVSHLEARRKAAATLPAPPPSAFRALLGSAGAFLHSYVLRRQVMLGYDGLLLSVAQAQTTFWTYAFRREPSLASDGARATTLGTS